MTTVNKNNWTQHTYYYDDNIDMTHNGPDENDVIDLRGVYSPSGMLDVTAGNGNDVIQGSEYAINFISGDYSWGLDELPPDYYYQQFRGNDTIYANGYINFVHGGPKNDKFYGGNGINIYSFKAGDSEVQQELLDSDLQKGDVIYASSGSDYLYFRDVSFANMQIWDEDNDDGKSVIGYGQEFNLIKLRLFIEFEIY